MTPLPSRRSATPEIDIQLASPLWATQPLAVATARAAIAAAAALAKASGDVSIVLTDDAAIRALNRDWRGIDKPTNVLSFPAAKNAPKKPSKNPSKQAGTEFLGDIVIAYETLVRECADEDRIFLHHLAHLTVHGFLHLLGYDHQTERQADAMEALESRIMTLMQMPDPFLARDLERS